MKKLNLLIIALVAIIGFALIGCPGDSGGDDDNTTTPGSGTFAGKDVLGNSYSLSVGSDASRAAVKGDRFEMNVTPRDGKARRIRGEVKDINNDGTLTLETDTGEEFNVVVDETTLDSVSGVGDEMPQIPFEGDALNDGSKTLTPRTFGKINLRATRWTDTGKRGEHWGSGKSVLLRDFPTNVSTLQKNEGNRYSITVKGTTDKPLPYLNVEVQGLDENDVWHWLTGFEAYNTITAGNFEITRDLWGVENTVNLLDYKEIILQVTNVMNYTNDNQPGENKNNGSIPADIPDGQIMATITNFNISLKDKSREAFAGNMDDFHYGIRSDGMSAEYTRAAWILTSNNIADAKKPGAKFEFVMTGLNGNDTVDYDYLDEENITLSFVWQDPERNLWWENEYQIIGRLPDDNYTTYHIADGVEWLPWQKKIRIDIAKAVGSQFAASTKLNFIIGYWWRGGEDGATECIDELGISGANIIAPPAPSAGNMGNWYYGYDSTGVTFHLKQAVWHLPTAVLTTAKTSGAKLEVVFANDIQNLTVGTNTGHWATIALVWQGIDIDRWWPTAVEEGIEGEHIKVFEYDSTTQGIKRTGVTYDQTAKKLTIPLSVLQAYDTFKTANDVNLVLDFFYGVTDSEKIDEKIGIVSANIVAGD